MRIEHAQTRLHVLDLDRDAIAAGFLGLVLPAAVAVADGGYFQESWAWVALVTLFLATLLLLVRGVPRLATLELTLLGGIAGYGAWVTLSALWSPSVTSTLLETQRVLAYLGAVGLGLLVVRRRTVTPLLAGLLAGVTMVAGYALLTRILPGTLAPFDTDNGYRLARPIGYWNGLGLFAVLGTLLALGFAARARSIPARALAGAIPVVLVPTVYFTFSRGSWAALVVGIAAAIALDTRRLQLIATLLVLSPWPAIAVLLSSRADGLSRIDATLEPAEHDGHRVFLAVVLLVVLAAAVSAALAVAERNMTIGTGLRRAFAGLLIGVVAVAGGVLFAQHGSPWSLADRGWGRITAAPKDTGSDLNNRIFELSSNGRIDLWQVAWNGFESHPVRGSGSGTFWQLWLQKRPNSAAATDAHNLYVETLAEAGVVGLALLLVVLAVPLVAAVRARRSPLVATAAAAYVAWLAHMAVDWDWELMGVSLVALLVGVALVASARRRPRELVRSIPLAVAAIATMVVFSVAALGGLLANVPLGQARKALERGDWSAAERDARRAERWAPWSAQVLQTIGEAQVATGDVAVARLTLARALDRDPHNWLLWADYAQASEGKTRRTALATAVRLNPLEESLGALRTELERGSKR